jgi:hypothetical protein
MHLKKSGLCLVLASGALATAAHGQSLTTLFAGGNSGSAGGIIFFDVNITNPIIINSLDVNTATLGSLGLTVYTTPGTYLGNETNMGAWTQVATGSGSGAGVGNPTAMLLNMPVQFNPGSYGIAIVGAAPGLTSLSHTYTNGTGANQFYANADLSLNAGAAQNVPFSGAPFTPRVFNGTIHYILANPNAVGACCFPNGTCDFITVAACHTGGGSFRGENITCAAANCPQPGACCFPDGTCQSIFESACTASGGTWQGAHITCAAANCPQPPTGACCTAGGCTVVNIFQCDAQSGVYRGDNTSCATACEGVFVELEPNNTKAEANILTMASGDAIIGISTGSTATGTGTANADYFRIKTTPANLGIYRHRMTLSSTTPGNSGWVRGLTQTAAAPGIWPGPVGTATATESTAQAHQLSGTDRVNMWYGFGKEEEVYYRVSGLASTTGTYIATLQTEAVTPTNLGSFQAGVIVIDTSGMGHTSDTALRIYDQNLNPIHGFANEDASTYGGASANSTTASFLLREYSAGTYFMGITIGPLASDQGAPCDDGIRTSPMMDFPNVAVNTGAATTTDLSFKVIDSVGETPVAASRGGRGEIAWFRFEVTGTAVTGACCFPSGGCEVLAAAICALQGGAYAGDNVTCAAANCPQPGACCVPAGCGLMQEAACNAANGTFRGPGTVCATANCPPATQVLMELPPFVSTFSSATLTRGMWFIAPADFVINGLRVPDESGHGLQNVELVRLNAPPPAFSLTTNDFVSLARHIGVPSSQVIPVHIPVMEGDVIGILGGCGDASTMRSSYAAVGPFQSSILGLPTTLSRLGMQFNLVTSPTQDLWTEAAGAMTRVEVYYSAGAPPCYVNCDGSTVEPILNVDDFTCFINEYASGQGLPPSQQLTHYANCDGSTIEPILNVDDFTCFINAYAQGCP